VLPRPEPLGVEGRVVAFVDEVEAQVRQVASEYLRNLAVPLLADGIPVATEVRFGDPVVCILAAAREWGTDMIAMATRGLAGTRNLRSPSVADRVLRMSPVPVLVARRCGQRAA
jgi:nucleotide-binding universal stress UspA family protein